MQMFTCVNCKKSLYNSVIGVGICNGCCAVELPFLATSNIEFELLTNNKWVDLGSRYDEYHLPQKLANKSLHDFFLYILTRGGVEDTRLEAKAKDTKKIRGQGQGQPFRGQTLSRSRTGMLEAKAKDQGHSRKCSPKKKVFKKVFQAISNLKA